MICPARSAARLLARAIAHVVARDGLFEKPGERRPVRAPSPPRATPPPSPEPAACGCGCEAP
ncbi:MAG: hypothetical protein ABIO70_24095 [Pseudomonadota bacterium]